MTKKGFTLMELLVSIFISGMVMLALVAMWKTSSNHTAQAQRQTIIKNENTVFLRKIYSDFISSSEIICPWSYSKGGASCNDGEYISVKEAVINPENRDQLMRITNPICGASNNAWATGDTLGNMVSRCIKPSYTIYVFDKDSMQVYRCKNNFLTENKVINISTLISDAHSFCSTASNRENIMPYVSDFSLTIPSDSISELFIDYTINRDFGEGTPPVYFKFKHFLTRKGGA